MRKSFSFCLVEEAEVAEGWLSHYKISSHGSGLFLSVPNELVRQQLDRKRCGEILSSLLKLRCGQDLTVQLEVDGAILPEIAVLEAAEPPAAFEAPKPASVLLYGRKVAEEPQTMDVKDEANGYVAQGEVIMYETFQTRSGRFFVKMTITDYNDSLDVRFFHENDGKFKGGVKERDWVRVRGDLRPDKYSHNELTSTPRTS